MITQKRLKEVLNYDQNTGVFTRKTGPYLGKSAGTLRPDGYVQIRIDGSFYRAHRLAWLYVTGMWPRSYIDHIDCNKANNKFSNLREADKTENNCNRGKQTNNKSGYKGVTRYSSTNSFRAQITYRNKQIHLGYFKTREAAFDAYKKAAERLHEEFARTS